MTRIFTVVCPICKGKFECLSEQLRHKSIKLICPYCGHAFDQEDSPQIEE